MQTPLQLVSVIKAHADGASPAGQDGLADCAAISISFNTAEQTARSVQSLLSGTVLPRCIYVLDNASHEADFERLRRLLPSDAACDVRLYRSAQNLGFAQGSNALLALALAQPQCRYVLLLNNDAVARPRLLQALRDALIQGQPGNVHMAGARMHRLADAEAVDTLGIALYASLMPADRKTLDDPFMGPTGGCALYSRTLLDAVYVRSGYWFDPRYFCYCEDTDLVLRARLLGYDGAFVDELLALHEGQASSQATGPSDFVAYHGLRNSIWMQVKLIPAPLLARYGVLLLLAHVATGVRYVLTGRVNVLWRVYRDAWHQRAAFVQERKQWMNRGGDRAPGLQRLIAPRFYRRGYFFQIVRQWWRRAISPSGR